MAGEGRVKVLRFVGIGAGALLLVVAAVAFGARFADGPVAMFPGGALASGGWSEPGPGDLERLREIGEIEFQLLEPPRSRTTWVVVHDGHAYVPCGALTVEAFKQWPHETMRDGRAVIRFDGKRQRRTVVRVDDPEIRGALFREVARKYPFVASEGDAIPEDPDAAWFFRLDPRAEG